jgi:hypothetical protein
MQTLLLSQDKAVLGLARRVLHLRGAGLQWAPADDLCVAGELLTHTAAGNEWAIKRAVNELQPA